MRSVGAGRPVSGADVGACAAAAGTGRSADAAVAAKRTNKLYSLRQ